MSLSWKHESPAHWDQDKARVVGGAPKGVFKDSESKYNLGQMVPGEWWQVTSPEGQVIGYGWMDIVWGDGEILLAVAPDAQGAGVGAWILERLSEEAAARGLRYIYNMVLPTHPERAAVTAWLTLQGFGVDNSGERLQKQVA